MGERDLIVRTHDDGEVRSLAAFSPCERYRYILQRRWDGGRSDEPGDACFVMMNPSTADERQDDPTIRRCIGYAKAWGYEAITIVNAFALRSTDPKGLLAVEDPVGPENARIVVEAARRAAIVVCAWGLAPRRLRIGTAKLVSLFQENGIQPHALRVTKDGTPAHPLYLPKGLRPFKLGASHAA